MANSVLEFVQKNILAAGGVSSVRAHAIFENCDFSLDEKEKAKKGEKAILKIIEKKIEKGELNDEKFIKDLFFYSPAFSELQSLPIGFHASVVQSEAFKGLTADDKFDITTKILLAGGFDYSEDKGWYHVNDRQPIQKYAAYKDVFQAHVASVRKADKMETLQKRGNAKEAKKANQKRVEMVKAFNSLPEEHQRELIQIRAKGDVMCEQGNMAQYAAYKNEFMVKYRQYVKQDKILDHKSAQANIQGTKEWLERKNFIMRIHDCKDPKEKEKLKAAFTEIYGEYQGYDENGVRQFVREDGNLKMHVPGEKVVEQRPNAEKALMAAIAREKGVAFDKGDDIMALSNLAKQERAFTEKSRTF